MNRLLILLQNRTNLILTIALILGVSVIIGMSISFPFYYVGSNFTVIMKISILVFIILAVFLRSIIQKNFLLFLNLFCITFLLIYGIEFGIKEGSLKISQEMLPDVPDLGIFTVQEISNESFFEDYQPAQYEILSKPGPKLLFYFLFIMSSIFVVNSVFVAGFKNGNENEIAKGGWLFAWQYLKGILLLLFNIFIIILLLLCFKELIIRILNPEYLLAQKLKIGILLVPVIFVFIWIVTFVIEFFFTYIASLSLDKKAKQGRESGILKTSLKKSFFTTIFIVLGFCLSILFAYFISNIIITLAYMTNSEQKIIPQIGVSPSVLGVSIFLILLFIVIIFAISRRYFLYKVFSFSIISQILYFSAHLTLFAILAGIFSMAMSTGFYNLATLRPETYKIYGIIIAAAIFLLIFIFSIVIRIKESGFIESLYVIFPMPIRVLAFFALLTIGFPYVLYQFTVNIFLGIVFSILLLAAFLITILISRAEN